MAGRSLVSLFWFLVFIASVATSLSNALPMLLTSPYMAETDSAFTWPMLLIPAETPVPSPMPAPKPPSRGIKGVYWPSWLAEKFPPTKIPTTYFSHVFYAFIAVDVSTYQLSITQPDDQWMKNFTATLHAKEPPTKAFLSIVEVDASSTFSNMVSNANNRATFIESSIDVARKYDFDGLDLDWEFPKTAEDMSNLALLLKEWHDALAHESQVCGQPQLLLAAAVYFASNFFLSDPPRTYPGDAISKYVDFVNPMCYNYHGRWNTSVTAEHALLYDKTSKISTSYGISSWIEAGVPPEKIVMGVPLFGRTWKLKDPNVNGIGAPAVGVGPGNDGIMTYAEIIDFNLANVATEVYHNETVSTYSYAGNNWIGYDGIQSTVEKVKFAQDQGLGGYFFWALGYDKNWNLSIAASSAWDNSY